MYNVNEPRASVASSMNSRFSVTDTFLSGSHIPYMHHTISVCVACRYYNFVEVLTHGMVHSFVFKRLIDTNWRIGLPDCMSEHIFVIVVFSSRYYYRFNVSDNNLFVSVDNWLAIDINSTTIYSNTICE